MTFWYGSGSANLWRWLIDPDPAIFLIDLQDANKTKKKILLIAFEGTVYLHQFLLDDRRIWIRIQKAQKHMDPTDPDPQHCVGPRLFVTDDRFALGVQMGEIFAE